MRNTKYSIIALILSIFIILYLTIFSRQTGAAYQYQLFPFWSYIEWAKGSWRLGFEILCNILLFVPFGFFASNALSGRRKAVLLLGLCLSGLIELSQLAFRLGLCELDDVFNNCLGTALGYMLYDQIRKHKRGD